MQDYLTKMQDMSSPSLDRSISSLTTLNSLYSRNN